MSVSLLDITTNNSHGYRSHPPRALVTLLLTSISFFRRTTWSRWSRKWTTTGSRAAWTASRATSRSVTCRSPFRCPTCKHAPPRTYSLIALYVRGRFYCAGATLNSWREVLLYQSSSFDKSERTPHPHRINRKIFPSNRAHRRKNLLRKILSVCSSQMRCVFTLRRSDRRANPNFAERLQCGHSIRKYSGSFHKITVATDYCNR